MVALSCIDLVLIVYRTRFCANDGIGLGVQSHVGSGPSLLPMTTLKIAS